MRAPDGAFYLEPRCRQRRRGGQILRLGARRSPRTAVGGRLCGRRAALRARRTAELRRACLESARRAAARGRRRATSACRRRKRTQRVARAKAALSRGAREARAPGRDDKILTSWNALAIAGLARAARALDEPQWADLAIGAADALRATAWRDGRLLATRKGERAHLNAYLDDYAFLLAALVELMQTRFRARRFRRGRCELADVLLAQFEDRDARRLLLHEPRSRAR